MDIIHTPEQFIELIRAIASAYHFDLKADRAYLRLSKDSHNLTLEKLDSNLVRVAQYSQVGTETVPSPNIEFLIEILEAQKGLQESWIPLRITEGFNFRQVGWTDSTGLLIDVNSSGAEEVAARCSHWTNAIKQQHWLINEQPASGVVATVRY